MTDQERLAKAGTLLYGALWQVPLAKDLAISDRTMRRWKAGERDIPVGVWGQLALLCQDRAGRLLSFSHKVAK